MNDWTLLIDFGTSFSRAAIVDADGRVEPIEVDGADAMPSGVWADSSGRLSAGLGARRSARLAPERWDRAPKRSLGRPALALGKTDVPVTTVVAQVFRQLSAGAVKRRRGAPREVWLTCPARLDAARRQALLDAARLAGLDAPAVAGGVHLVDTPFAAGRYLSENGQLSVGGKVALFDLGGGGVETAVIERTEGGLVVRALGGIAGLGGEMFDELLYHQVVAKVQHGPDPQLAGRLLDPPDDEWRRSAEFLFREVRRAKEELTHTQNVRLDTGALSDHPVTLSRFELEALLRPEILRSARELAATIELAGSRPRLLNGIYLTGGASAMPFVERVVFDVLGVHASVLDETSFLSGAASWTLEDRVDPERTPITAAGRGVAELPVPATAQPAPGANTNPEPRTADPSTSDPTTVDHAGRAVWLRRWPLPAGVLVLALLCGWALRGAPFSNTASATPTTSSAPTAVTPGSGTLSSSPPIRLSTSVSAVRGLSARTKGTAVVLSWRSVPGAVLYQVRRDATQPKAWSATTGGTRFTDHPNDGARHEYSVVAIDSEDLPGPAGQPVQGRAPAPYGPRENIANAWTAIIPAKPGVKGSGGQVCHGASADTDFSTGRISCAFPKGPLFEIDSYGTSGALQARVNELSDVRGVRSGRWSVSTADHRKRLGGRLLLGDVTQPTGPWRWWTFDTSPTFSMYASWPGHSAHDLAVWWRQRAPFRL